MHYNSNYFIFLCFYLVYVACSNIVTINPTYYYLYHTKIKEYNSYFRIKEIQKLDCEGLIDYSMYKNKACYKVNYIYIKQENSYETKYKVLIHELTHYLQCLHSHKHYNAQYKITNNINISI